MQPIKKDELFRNLGGFLKSKGIELNDGSYARRIQQGCNLLSDAINATQKTVTQTVKETKVQADEALDRLRQTIHDKTAPPKSKSSPKPRGKRPPSRRP